MKSKKAGKKNDKRIAANCKLLKQFDTIYNNNNV